MSIVKQVYQTIAGEEELTIVTDEFNDFWFLGVVIARILGYKDPRGTVNKKVDITYKKSYSELMTERSQNDNADSSQTTNVMTNGRGQNGNDDESLHPHTIFLNEFGLYQLIMTSKLEIAKQFQHWVYGVIKSLRKGECSNEVVVLNSKVEQLTAALLKSTELASEAVAKADRMFEEVLNSNKEYAALTKRVIDMAEHVVVRPQNEKLLHAIAVYEVGTVEEDDEQRLRCKVLRTQQRNLERAEGQLQKLNPKSKLIFRKQPCPNGFNVLNAVKEEMNRRDIHFKAKANEIQVPIDEHTVASLFNNITTKNSS